MEYYTAIKNEYEDCVTKISKLSFYQIANILGL